MDDLKKSAQALAGLDELEGLAQIAALDQAESEIALRRAVMSLTALEGVMSRCPWAGALLFRWRPTITPGASALEIELAQFEPALPDRKNEYGQKATEPKRVVEAAALAARLAAGKLSASDLKSGALHQESMKMAVEMGLAGTGFNGVAAYDFLAHASRVAQQLGRSFLWAAQHEPDWAKNEAKLQSSWNMVCEGARDARSIASALGFEALAAKMEARELEQASQDAPGSKRAHSL